MKNLSIVFLTIVPFLVFSQKSKVQGAWRSMSDYESTLKETPDISYLLKAKENIDLAVLHEDTKNQFKTYSYRFRIYTYLFAENLKVEEKKLAETITNKNERTQTAYGNIAIIEFQEALISLNKIQELDPKIFEKLGKGDVNSEEDGKLFLAMSQIQAHQVNLATGRYNAKKYDEASDFFESLAISNTFMTGKVDTSNFYNACISAQKAKNHKKMVDFNKKMIDQKIATPYNFQTIYDLILSDKDTTSALEILSAGRKAFPNDVYLMNRETEVYLQKGQQEKALANLQTAIGKEPNNAILQFALGNVYDNLANPKGKSGKDTIKPKDFEALVISAAEHYQKAIDLKPASQESYFNALYNLGALYNNYGNTLYTKSIEKVSITDLVKKQKEFELKSIENYKKAIPYLEQALLVKTDDRTCLSALRTLYYKTGNEAKGKEMNDKLKATK